MTIEIPDDLTQDLDAIAGVEKKTVEQVAIERLRTVVRHRATPKAILESIRALKHPSASSVADLENAIAAARLPVDTRGTFENWPRR